VRIVHAGNLLMASLGHEPAEISFLPFPRGHDFSPAAKPWRFQVRHKMHGGRLKDNLAALHPVFE